MSGDRLTRTELSWLLTQEAKSAAEKLRKGVGSLSIPPPEIKELTPPPSSSTSGRELLPPPSERGLGDDTGVEGVLNRLDETMSMLASLYGTQPRGRRGRIDIAALLWEIAPEARVQIEIARAMKPASVSPSPRKAPYSIVPYQTTHNVGGTMTGDNPANSVVNRYGQSWDVPNLFVTGAGLFPQNPGYNPTGTLAALAYMAADAIKTHYVKTPGALVQA